MGTQRGKDWKAHVAIPVRDVQRSIAFYRKIFGVEPCKVRPGYAKFDLSHPALNFTLQEASFEGRGAISAMGGHMGIQVGSTEEVLAERERWIREGLSTRDEMGTECCHALQDKTWVRDPDGNEWEVFVVLQDDLAVGEDRVSENSGAERTCCAPACYAPAETARG